MDRQRHLALWLRMLAKHEIRLARASFNLFQTLSVSVATQFVQNGQAAAEDIVLTAQQVFYNTLNIGTTGTTKELIHYTFTELDHAKKSTFQDIVQSYIHAHALEKASLITFTTQKILRHVILKGEQQGIGVVHIAANIRKAVADTAPTRARTIGRTETHNAATYGMQVAAEDTQERLTREWVSVFDEQTRDDHAEADGQQRGMDDDFEVGGEAIDRPGEGSAENAINCRCTLIYIPT